MGDYGYFAPRTPLVAGQVLAYYGSTRRTARTVPVPVKVIRRY